MTIGIAIPMFAVNANIEEANENITAANEPSGFLRWISSTGTIGGIPFTNLTVAPDAEYVDVTFTLDNGLVIPTQNAVQLQLSFASFVFYRDWISFPANPIISYDAPFGIDFEFSTSALTSHVGVSNNVLLVTVHGADTAQGETPIDMYATIVVRINVHEAMGIGYSEELLNSNATNASYSARLGWLRPVHPDAPSQFEGSSHVARENASLHFEAGNFSVPYGATYVDIPINLVNTQDQRWFGISLTMFFGEAVNNGYIQIPANPVSNFVGMGHLQVDPVDLMGFTNNIAFGFVLNSPMSAPMEASFIFRVYIGENFTPGQTIDIGLSRPSGYGFPGVLNSFTITRGVAESSQPEFVKTPSATTASPGDTISWTLRGFHNRSGEAVTDFTVVDMPGVGLNFQSATIPAFTNGAGITFEVRYTVAGSNEWRVYQTGIDASQPFTFSLPQSGNLHYTNIALYFGDVPAYFALGDEIVMTFIVGATAPNNTLVNRFAVMYGNTEREGGSPDNPTLTPDTSPETGIPSVVIGLAVAVISIATIGIISKKKYSGDFN